MTLLTAAVVLIGALSLVNLLFAFGIIRRLREHTELLNQLGGQGDEVVMRAAGGTVEEFAATTIDGEPVKRSTVELAGFFSVGCRHCTTQLPHFVERARAHPSGRDAVFAVVVADEDQDPLPFTVALEPIARVVLEEPAGPVAHAFGVVAFPAFATLDPAGVVVAVGPQVSALPAAAHSDR